MTNFLTLALVGLIKHLRHCDPSAGALDHLATRAQHGTRSGILVFYAPIKTLSLVNNIKRVSCGIMDASRLSLAKPSNLGKVKTLALAGFKPRQ